MNKFCFLSFCFFLLALEIYAQQALPPLIPWPQQVKATDVPFVFNANTMIVTDRFGIKDAHYLRQQLEKNYGLKIKVRMSGRPLDNSINIFRAQDEAKPDSYKIFAGGFSVMLLGKGDGIFYGLQTLAQLLLVDSINKTTSIPGVQISDYPRFKWRGMHLDVVRHFFGKEEVKKYLDHLARYKMNVFHWHLTDDQGWRIEIKRYPKLTSTGAWRNGSQYGRYSDMTIDTIRYGGYYTQKDVKEILEYAASRHITVVPEIEMPGHALAAIASYLQLACRRDTIFEVEKTWGVFEDVFCTRDSSIRFLENVLAEVIELFPSSYIHIGGDECPRTRWKACPDCQAVMKREGLATEDELQGYFVKRIERFLQSKGRKAIGWDEILETGVPPQAAIMSWRGIEGGKAAARMGHDVVMSPGSHCYFDHYQSRPDSLEPIAIGGYSPVGRVYDFEPVPDSLSAAEQKHIIGAQGNVWTEYIKDWPDVEYMALPRMAALAEALWLNPSEKNYTAFRQRLIKHSILLNRLKVNYARHILSE